MQKMKIEKRILEEIEGIRKMAALLPSGKANALQNKCNKVASYARKAQAMMDAPQGSLWPQPTNARWDDRRQEDMAAIENAKRAVFQAMTSGRKVSLKDSQEFRTSQMHTTMTKIRRDIENRALPWVLCDQWEQGDKRRYKKYWLIPKEETE